MELVCTHCTCLYTFMVILFGGAGAQPHGTPDFESAPHTLSTKTDRVVAHTSSAVVFSHGEAHLDEGPHLVFLRNLSALQSSNQSLEEKSLQVTLEGGNALVERIVWDDVPLATNDALKELADEIDGIDKERARLAHLATLSGRHLATLQDFGSNLVMPSPELVRQGGSVMETLKASYAAILEVDGSIHALKEQQAELARRSSDLRARLQRSSEPQRVAKVYISVQKPGLITFRLQRIVAEATWRPHYEVHVNSTTGLVTMMYHALVRQQSGHPWSNVSMELCTGAPSTDRRLPLLSPWFIVSSGTSDHHEHRSGWTGSRKKQVEHERHSRKRRRVKVMMDHPDKSPMVARSAQLQAEISDDADEYDEADAQNAGIDEGGAPSVGSFMPSDVVSSGVSDVFVLPKRQTIPTSQDIRVHIATISLKANLTYTAVPKKSTKVYVQAGVANDSPFTLLPGSSLVFVDGSFMGSSNIHLIPTNGHAFLDVGIDNGLLVTKKVVSDERKSTGGVLSGWTTTTEIQYELVLKSMRSFGVTVRVQEQVPLPQSEDVKVHLIEPERLGELRADHKAEQISANTTLRAGGEVSWERYLPPDSVVKIPFRFSIEVDAKRHIRNFEL